MGKIKVLDDIVAKKIAAGEVIERPASVLRELLDNAIDSGATNIIVDVAGGGIDKIRVADDGSGMDGDDLKLSVLTHATSKVKSEADLYNLHTLGFRGEALASIGVCSKLEITSVFSDREGVGQVDTEETTGHRLTVHAGNVISFEERNIPRGTIVESCDLFYSFPARRNFLKRSSTEATQCKKTFLEKALAFPSITFKYFNDGKPVLILPAGTLQDRLLASFRSDLNPKLIRTIKAVRDYYSVEMVAALPEISLKSRRLIQVFVNNRRIEEYSLSHAAEIGYAEYIPGGLFPVCFIFVTVDPSRVDFNVHPTKREAKFRDLRGMHHTISQAIKDFLLEEKGVRESVVDGDFARSLFRKSEEGISFDSLAIESDGDLQGIKSNLRHGFTPSSRTESGGGYCDSINSGYYKNVHPEDSLTESVSEEVLSQGMQPGSDGLDFRYLGRLFNGYLLTERRGTLYIVDQHAAHERILFEEYVRREPTVQPLLIPLDLEVSGETSGLIEENLDNFRKLGILLHRKNPEREESEKDGENDWEVTALPREAVEYKDDIIPLLRLEKGSFIEMKKELFANMACKAAVKDGDVLDYLAAVELLKKSFRLEFPRCPHGRPIWFALTEDELRRLVGRNV